MSEQQKIDRHFEKGYIMLYAKELKMMHKVLAPEQVARVLYNIGNVAIREHGGEPPEDMEMSDIEYIAYKTIKERIKGNLENAAKRKPGGAPEGNTNAQAKDKEVKMEVVKLLYNMGISVSKISEQTGYPQTTIRRYIKEIENPPNKHRGAPNNHKKTPNKHNYNNNNNMVGCLDGGGGQSPSNNSGYNNGEQATVVSPVASGSENSPASQEEIDAMWAELDNSLYSH